MIKKIIDFFKKKKKYCNRVFIRTERKNPLEWHVFCTEGDDVVFDVVWCADTNTKTGILPSCEEYSQVLEDEIKRVKIKFRNEINTIQKYSSRRQCKIKNE